MSFRWCCRGVRDLVSQAGKRGFGLFVDDSDASGPSFVLQFRAMDVGAERPVTTSVWLTLVSQARITFCPWCGRNLKRFYRRELNALARPELAMSTGDEID